MTLEQIRAMDDLDLELHVTALLKGRSGDYTHDLNAAMTLVPRDAPALSEFEYALMAVLDWDINTSIWRRWVVGRNPRNLCEAFLLWKGSAT